MQTQMTQTQMQMKRCPVVRRRGETRRGVRWHDATEQSSTRSRLPACLDMCLCVVPSHVITLALHLNAIQVLHVCICHMLIPRQAPTPTTTLAYPVQQDQN